MIRPRKREPFTHKSLATSLEVAVVGVEYTLARWSQVLCQGRSFLSFRIDAHEIQTSSTIICREISMCDEKCSSSMSSLIPSPVLPNKVTAVCLCFLMRKLKISLTNFLEEPP